MKLQDLAKKQSSKQTSKVFESYFGNSVSFDRLSRAQSRNLLNRVKKLVTEHKKSSDFHLSQHNPAYLKLMMMEQILTQKLYEDATGAMGASGSMGSTGASSASDQAKAKANQLATLTKIKDPKLQGAMKKSMNGQNLSTDEQQLVANAAMAGGQLNEFFYYPDERPRAEKSRSANKSRDVLGRRSPGEVGSYPSDYKAMKKDPRRSRQYPIGGPKGNLPEDQINELSKKTLGSYAKGAAKNLKSNFVDQKTKEKRVQGIGKAVDRLTRESRNPSSLRRRIYESEIQQAQVVLAAQDMVDQVQKVIEQVTSVQFKDLPALVQQIQNEIGQQQATQFNSDATSALTNLVQSLQQSKVQLESAVGVVTGTGAIVPGQDTGTALGNVPEPTGGDLGGGLGGDMGGDLGGMPPMGDDENIDIDIDDEIPPPSASLGRKRRK